MRLAYLPLVMIVGFAFIVGSLFVPLSWELRTGVAASVTLFVLGLALWAHGSSKPLT